MNAWKVAIVISLLTTPFANSAEIAQFASFSAGSDVNSFLAGDELKGGSAQYSKFALVFKEPKELKRIEFKSCENEIKDGIDVFFDPGFRRVFLEGGVKKYKFDVPGEPVRSIALVFGLNHDFCVRDLKITAKNGKAIEIKAPRNSEATFKPVDWGRQLFDQKPQTTQVSWKESTIEFAQPQTFDRMRVWQGLGTEPTPGLTLTFDATPAVSFEIATAAGLQELKLETPVTAKKVVVKSKNGGLGELRFANGDDEFVPAALFAPSEDGEMRKVASTSFASMLDRELVAKVDDKETWTFRFRGDGTYFIRGYGDDMSEASSFSSLGSYKIDKPTKSGAKLKLSGVRVATAQAWDGALCPFECGGSLDPKVQLVSDLVELEEAKAGAVMIRNRVSPSKRTLPFSDLKSRNSAFED